MSLQKPPKWLRQVSLAVKTVNPSQLLRVTRFGSGEPFFGKAGANRFDDPRRQVAVRFGTCYCSLHLDTAIAETVLHDEMPVKGRFRLSKSDFDSRYVVRFEGEPLRLANLTGAHLKALGSDGALSTVTPYALPQAWSKAIHGHPDAVDGIWFISRHLNDKPAVVIFERSGHKLQNPQYQALVKAQGLSKAVKDLRIDFAFP